MCKVDLTPAQNVFALKMCKITILENIKVWNIDILFFPVRRGDVLSAWCGIRPLVMDPNKSDTQSIARNHIIEISENNLITIAGKLGPKQICFFFNSLQLYYRNLRTDKIVMGLHRYLRWDNYPPETKRCCIAVSHQHFL